ncbi:tRNA 2-selenouridine(34) synthase MnmH [Chitinimonas taiwanensis]|uniref:tRNA 2-selenouridine(34) synthase MnmH n=1 Tax=Chitinimonas taiwanensis TaxID=240412 RepID=UPI0035AF9022
MKDQLATLAERSRFDEIIDVRTPAEFAEDHLPGAINAPVLSNAERVIVGTLYKQNPFEATRVGAAMVARNLAQHLDTLFADRPHTWRPLVYCWRGGKRSGAMTAWMNLIGWRARQLEGGYKGYRRWVLDELDVAPARYRYVVLAGNTGCGKTRLLHALAEEGAQVLDLEGLARHRGSLLGAWPDAPQPSQKAFDTALVAALNGFTTERPVFVEAESKRIGLLHLPESLMQALRSAAAITVSASLAQRVAYLCQDYAHLFDNPADFATKLARLTELHGKDAIARWQALLAAGERAALFEALIVEHYDPAYRRSRPQIRASGETIQIAPAGDLSDAAREIIRSIAPGGINRP